MIVLGRIAAPFGVEGWLRVRVFGDDPAAWRKMRHWWLGANAEAPMGEAWQRCTFKAQRFHGKGLLVQFQEVADRSVAERLQGFYIAAPRTELPKTAAGEFYWADLLGLEVVNTQAVPFGKIVNVLESGAHPVLVVDGVVGSVRGTEDSQEVVQRLLPFVSAVIVSVEISARRVVVDWEADW